MKVFTQEITCPSHEYIDFVDITDDVREAVAHSGVTSGSVVVYTPHTTTAVVINHNEPMLLQDFMRMLYRLVPVEEQYAHDLFELRRGAISDGRSNGHSHCKALLLGVSETIPLVEGVMMLGKMQSIFAVDLDGPRKRSVIVHVTGL